MQQDGANSITLYNTNKLDALTQINLKGDNNHNADIVANPEYIENLEKSFKYTPIEANVPNNINEDSQILFAQMQNSRLWQLSARKKYLQRMRIPAELGTVIKK